MRHVALGSNRSAGDAGPVLTSTQPGSLCLAGHLQGKSFARGFDDSFTPIFRVIDPKNPTKLRTSASVGYLLHYARH